MEKKFQCRKTFDNDPSTGEVQGSVVDSNNEDFEN